MRLDRAVVSWALSSPVSTVVSVLQDGDGGDVGERLSDDDVVVAHRSGLGAEQVEGADGLTAQPHRDGIGGAEAGLHRDGGEAGPAIGGGR